jgi:PIN domain nuclease of toxin-antitoxin system
MRILLDTHVLIWYLHGDKNLPSHIKEIIDDPGNEIAISTISLWEIAIKINSGKLKMSMSLQQMQDFFATKDVEWINIKFSALSELSALPFHHKDPFDRLLIAQAKAENLTIISADQHFGAYPVRVLW